MSGAGSNGNAPFQINPGNRAKIPTALVRLNPKTMASKKSNPMPVSTSDSQADLSRLELCLSLEEFG